MTVLNSFKFVSYKPVSNSSAEAARRLKLVAKIYEQLAFAANADYQPTKIKRVKDADGNVEKVEVAKRVKRWWSVTADGKINLTIRYGSKPIEFAKGKNAIELENEEQVAATLLKVKEAVQAGELDELIAQHAQYGRQLKSKNGSK
ncbi:hypothetical protein P9J64_13600 [Deltaproteobacteria bacterium IMCC39524]|nr:hypothetical protein [Deltaproteobacteria bacterium IMCC39524]